MYGNNRKISHLVVTESQKRENTPHVPLSPPFPKVGGGLQLTSAKHQTILRVNGEGLSLRVNGEALRFFG
jgi:hypothetical protein